MMSEKFTRPSKDEYFKEIVKWLQNAQLVTMLK